MCVQNLKFVALPVPEIIGGTRANWTVPGYAHTYFSPKFLICFCSDGPCECTRENLKSVALPVPQIIGGTREFWAVPVYAHAPFSPTIFNGLYFG